MRISDWSSDVCSSDLLGSASGLARVCEQVRQTCTGPIADSVRETVGELRDRENRTLLCRKGIGSNINEFVTYSLQQRQTANPLLRGYDQGYLLRKRGTHSSSPWIVSPARSEEHTSELQPLMLISYAVFFLKNKIHESSTSTPYA